jgi:hypothetical protein
MNVNELGGRGDSKKKLFDFIKMENAGHKNFLLHLFQEGLSFLSLSSITLN